LRTMPSAACAAGEPHPPMRSETPPNLGSVDLLHL
jgi:hypothetical protein